MTYARTHIGMRALCALGPRVWAVGTSHGWIGYSDDGGDSFVAKTANPDPNVYGVQSLIFSTSYAWLLSGGVNGGRLFRSPLPDSSGTGLAWSTVFDLAAPPPGITTGAQSSFRNSCAAVNGAAVYLLEYGTVVTGGPSLYVSVDSGATWAKARTWPNAKHGHAVQVINGTPWVMLGDAGFADIGLWSATGATWARNTIYGEAAGGNALYGINFLPITIDGFPAIVAESDGHHGHGPLLFKATTPTARGAFIPLCRLPFPCTGTMRGLALHGDALYWITTGENGAVGPCDSVWTLPAPYMTPQLLECVPLNTFGTIGDPVVCGEYVYFGTFRVSASDGTNVGLA